MKFLIAPNSIVEEGAAVGEGTKVWYFCHIREKAVIGRDCSIGDDCYIDNGVIVGDRVRIGNRTDIYNGAIIKNDVIIGPGVKITNVRKPSPYHKAKKFLDTIVEEGVTIEANATILGGIKIGKGAIIGAGATVVYDVADGLFVAGCLARVPRSLRKENE